MMNSAEQENGWSKRRRAVHYRDGLMIALMAYRPLRLTNFASIVLGVHLVQQRGGWWLNSLRVDEGEAPLRSRVPRRRWFPSSSTTRRP